MRRLTHETSVHAGIYHSACKCRFEIKVRPGDRFPECPSCRHPVVWLFTRSAVLDLGKPLPPRPKQP